MPRTSNKRVRQETQSMDQRPVKKAKVQAIPTPTQEEPSVALQLPPELLLEILSYFETLPVPFKDSQARNYDHILPRVYLEQTDILRALSQTCRVWRQMFLPILWESLNVVSSHSSSGAWYKTLGESLIRKSKLVHEMPELASCVRSVSVCISRYAMRKVLPAFVSMLERLPNLENLQIIRTHHHMTTPLKEAFEGHVFPQIRALHLPSYSHHILRSCPNVVKVTCNSYDDGSKLISAIRKDCKYVEEVEGFGAQGNILKRLARAAPRLKAIKLNMLHYRDRDSADSLKDFKHLEKIVLVNSYLTEEHYQAFSVRYTLILQQAKGALKSSKSAVETRSFKFEGKDWAKKFDLGIVAAS